MSGPLHDAAAAVLGDRVLVFGGGTEVSSDEVQALPAPGGEISSGATAGAVGHLPSVRSDLSAVALGGRVYVLGGEANGVASDRAWRFDPATGRMSPASRLPFPVAGGAAAVVGSTAYLIGGRG